MPVKNLTPQLRTRLTRIEWAVGSFILLAILILVAAMAFYLFQTGKRKGWWQTKAYYFTFVESADGFSVGDPVKLMGFNVGEIIEIEAMPADDPSYNVYVAFSILEPYYGYIWSDSKVRIQPSDLLGNRFLEVTKGVDGEPSYKGDETGLTHFWNLGSGNYTPLKESPKVPFWIIAEESDAINERIDEVFTQIESALPLILSLTNNFTQTASKANSLLTVAETTLTTAQPILTNLTRITDNLTRTNGALGEWMIPPNLNSAMEKGLDNASQALDSAQSDLSLTASNLNVSLQYLASISSNLNSQVQANTNILTEVSSTVTNVHHLIEGLKGHWFLRSSFRDSNPETGKWKRVQRRQR